MSIDVRYVGQIHPDDTRSLWRIDNDGGHPVAPIAWAGDGTVAWGSATEPARRDPELDCALAILADHHSDPATIFDDAASLAANVLAQRDPTAELVIHASTLQATHERPLEFHADATPVRDLLAATIADTGEPLELAARGLGLDPALAERVASGDTTHLDLAEVRRICEQLYVTPPDLWRPAEADVIARLWPPSQWPTAQAIDLTAPISTVPPDTRWDPSVEPAATMTEVAVQ